MKYAVCAFLILGGCTTMSVPGDLFGPNEIEGKPSYTSSPAEPEVQPPALQEARLIPDFVRDHKGTATDEVRGFRVLEIAPGSVLDDMGFKQNDVLLKVDEIRATTPVNAMKGYQAMKDADFLEITILRDGREIVLENQ